MNATDYDQSAWEDAYNEAQAFRDRALDEQTGWYGTAGMIAAGLMSLWLLFTWVPM